jgi:hypothetical protein
MHILMHVKIDVSRHVPTHEPEEIDAPETPDAVYIPRISLAVRGRRYRLFRTNAKLHALSALMVAKYAMQA